MRLAVRLSVALVLITPISVWSAPVFEAETLESRDDAVGIACVVIGGLTHDGAKDEDFRLWWEALDADGKVIATAFGAAVRVAPHERRTVESTSFYGRPAGRPRCAAITRIARHLGEKAPLDQGLNEFVSYQLALEELYAAH